jgi:hypothetical protein
LSNFKNLNYWRGFKRLSLKNCFEERLGFKKLFRGANVAGPGGLIRRIAQKPKNNPGVFVHIDEMKISLIFFKKSIDN